MKVGVFWVKKEGEVRVFRLRERKNRYKLFVCSNFEVFELTLSLFGPFI